MRRPRGVLSVWCMETVIETHALTKKFGERVAVNGVDLTVAAGVAFGFLGPNGAGKTTAMRAVFGLVELDAGQVLWNGRPIEAAERMRVGYMPEERGLYPKMRVGEQLAYLATLHGMDDASAREAAARWAERLGVHERFP